MQTVFSWGLRTITPEFTSPYPNYNCNIAELQLPNYIKLKSYKYKGTSNGFVLIINERYFHERIIAWHFVTVLRHVL